MGDLGTAIDLGIRGLGPAEHIGHGSFADVYRAEHSDLRRTVAVKVMRTQVTDSEVTARVRRECHVLRVVAEHPHMVRVHDGGFTTNGRAFLVMEYVPGGSLSDALRAHRSIPGPEAAEVAIKIGRALSEAHRVGILHRDIRPANIMITAAGEPALGDFGITRTEAGYQSATGVAIDGFGHTAPEVLEGKAPTAAADVYSLGSTIYELMAGHAPYFDPGDESVWPLMKRVLSTPMPEPESLGMGTLFGYAFRRATARNPADRYQTVDEFVADLETAVDTPPLMVATPGDTNGATGPNRPDPSGRLGRTTDDQLILLPGDIAPTGPLTVEPPLPSMPDLVQAGHAPSMPGAASGLEAFAPVDRDRPGHGPEHREFDRVGPRIESAALEVGQTVDAGSHRLGPDRDVGVDGDGGVERPFGHNRDLAGADDFGLDVDGDLADVDAETDRERRLGSEGDSGRGARSSRMGTVGVIAAVIGAFGALVTGGLWLSSTLGDTDTPSFTVAVPGATDGPVIAGRDLLITVDGVDDLDGLGPAAGDAEGAAVGNGVLFRAVINGLTMGSRAPELPVIALAPGRHSVAVEVTTSAGVDVTEPVEVYATGVPPTAGYRANLASIAVESGAWSEALAAYDRLVDAGHEDVQLLVSDDFAQQAPGYWNLFVPGFGDDPAAAEAYCARYGLAVPGECFAAYFDPDA